MSERPTSAEIVPSASHALDVARRLHELAGDTYLDPSPAETLIAAEYQKVTTPEANGWHPDDKAAVLAMIAGYNMGKDDYLGQTARTHLTQETMINTDTEAELNDLAVYRDQLANMEGEAVISAYLPAVAGSMLDRAVTATHEDTEASIDTSARAAFALGVIARYAPNTSTHDQALQNFDYVIMAADGRAPRDESI